MTGYESKRAAAQDKVTDIDGHVVRDVRKPRKLPQRPWVELEGEEIRNLWEEATKPDRSTVTIVTSFARAIEAILKDKNNGT